MKIKIEFDDRIEKNESKIAMLSLHIEDMPVEDYKRLSELPKHIEKAFQDFFYMNTGIDKQDCLSYVIEQSRPDSSGIF